MTFSTPLSEVLGVGPSFSQKLKKLGIANVRDLLFYFPRTYVDFSRITKISDIKEGGTYCVKGELTNLKKTQTFKKRFSLTSAILKDATGSLRIVWFSQPYLAEYFTNGDVVLVAGKVTRDKDGIAFVNPSHEKDRSSLTHVGRIIPVYPETRGLSSRWLRTIIKRVLATISEIPETLPESIVREKRFLPVKQALWQIHFPNSMESADTAAKRFAFEELFYILLFVLAERKKIAEVKAPAIPFDPPLMKRLTNSLPFQLTDSQKKAAWVILKDLEKPRPMNRLLQGDVGSGKTIVATMAALGAMKAGLQVAFLSPTEILAKQHFKTVSEILQKFKVTIGLLTGSADRFVSPKLPNDVIEISRARLLKKTLEGDIDILIGTHALIEDKVKFENLGLLVVDEQHRFGIKQRAKLLRRSVLIPHLLSMTATPIPRTLALTLYGDLDLTLIKELPEGRKKIITKVVPPSARKSAYGFIAKQVQKGRQVFVICPRIERTEHTAEGEDIKTVKEEYEKLSKEVFPDLRVGMLHGKLSSREKEEVMKKFRQGKTDILVSTSVVEVGVDIPNAAVMMIEGADRFGLAQLHQFRGRVGRAEHQSYCLLFAESNSPNARARLKALEQLDSGFELAEQDLKIRGPGDFAGTKQWGIPDFAMTQLTNLELVQETRDAATKILDEDIALKKYPLLKQKIQELRAKLHLE
ncbi:MAG: ATP-dependent DNA helicase RecG [Parcubacteria group bacterium Greene0714_21]|nr:MAG: ATP-dependent DNA helicase RecG [Parcubacteria group bacterium Greene0416_39]TSC98208.1 MAG: ATP-dependent DNA helicase RecG [Parcubacteria group bacterium Greene1014_47]TSD04077.1 MAG: ATP-dependent DNA helicase RecG [Parcubacteria group bacterium Greene0714_21]